MESPEYGRAWRDRQEQEARAVVVWPNYRDLADGTADFPAAAGIAVPVDLTLLIQGIVIAPQGQPMASRTRQFGPAPLRAQHRPRLLRAGPQARMVTQPSGSATRQDGAGCKGELPDNLGEPRGLVQGDKCVAVFYLDQLSLRE